MKHALRSVLAALIVLASWHASAGADGCYVPEKAVAKLPAIPAQRAVVSFKDGRETLIVESRLEGDGRRFGWIVPVPSRPESVEACTPGTLKSVAMGIQPEIVHDLSRARRNTNWICLTALSFLLVWCVLRRMGVPRENRLVSGLAMVMLFVLAAAVLLPSLMAARRSSLETGGLQLPEGLTILERSRVGSYEIAVVAAEGAEALYRWLESEELAVPEALRPAVEDYAKRDWRFVTAKLVTDGKGKALPHPLRITFKTDRAVYPMKLTALSGADLDLELYVVGEGAAAAPGMKRVFCDRFRKVSGRDYWHVGLARAFDQEAGESLIGQSSRLALGHPGLMPALWAGCWVSKLTGKIAPAAMSQDFYIAWGQPSFDRQRLYSASAAAAVAHITAALILAAGAAVALIMWGYRRMSNRHALGGVLAVVAAAAAAFGAVKLALPQLEVTTYGGKGGRSSRGLREMRELVWLGAWEVREGKATPEGLARKFRERARKWANLYTGEPMREEDSPGNYTLTRKDGRPVLTLYDLGGTPVRFELGGKTDE